MPELPEVETIKRDLEKDVLGKTIVKVIVNRPGIIKQPSLHEFKKILTGARFTRILRRGKFLVLEIETGKKKVFFLAAHLRMTGQFVYGSKDPKNRVCLRFEDNSFLNYNDKRTLGELRIIADWRNLNIVKNMGPEPLDRRFRPGMFRQMLLQRSAKIKPLLLDQSFVAGIGNIYATEALFMSGIHPSRAANKLRDYEIRTLFKNIQKVLKLAIQCRGSSFSDYRDGHGREGGFTQHFFVYGRKKELCLQCRTPIKRMTLGGRGTYYCGKCQR